MGQLKLKDRCKIKWPDQIDYSKLERQKGFVKTWLSKGGIGTILAVTGFGKTIAMLLAALRYGNSPRVCNPKITVIVPKIKLYEDWEEHLELFDINWEVRTVQELVRDTKGTNSENTGLLILEEVHNYTSKEFGRVFDIYDYDYVIGASATIDEDDPRFSTIMARCPILGKVTLEEALQKEWVSPYHIYNLGFELTEEQRAYYDQLTEKFYKYFSTFNNNYNFMLACLNDEHTRSRHARSLNWEESAVLIHAAQGNRAVQDRKRLLYNLPQKIELSKKIVDKFPDRKFIGFSLTTDFADKLAAELGERAVPYHSDLSSRLYNKETGQHLIDAIDVDGKVRYKPPGAEDPLDWSGVKDFYDPIKLKRKGSKKLREMYLKQFEDPEHPANFISTAKALDEGLNVPGINASIVNSRYSNTRQSLQRLGRMLRVMPGKRAFQVEIYAYRTQDQKWLRDCQKESTNITYIDSIDEIAY